MKASLLFLFLVAEQFCQISAIGSEIVDEINYNPPADPTLYDIDTLVSPSSLFPLGGQLPLQRVHHTIKSSSSYLFVYGGYDQNGTILGDINLYHIPSQTWSSPILRYQCCNLDGAVIETTGADIPIDVPNIRAGFQGDFPLPRAEHDACVINEEMYLFGGITNEYGLMNDLYKFNPLSVKWIELTGVTGSEVPVRRAGHTFIADTINSKCYLFGGRKSYANSTSGYVGLYDMWSFDPLHMTWTRIDTPNLNSLQQPYARQYTAATMMNGDFYMFGGMDPQSGLYFQDMWVFHIAAQYWEEIKPASYQPHQYSPPPLAHAHLFPSLCSQPGYQNCGGLLIYGGMGSGGYCGTSLCGAKQVVLGQLYLYSFDIESWIPPFFDLNDADLTFDTKSNWLYARLSSAPFLNSRTDDYLRFNDRHRNYQGKYIKTYSMEKLSFLPHRGIFYEFGGVQAIDPNVINNNQQNALFVVVNETASHFEPPQPIIAQMPVQTVMPTNLDVGGGLYSDLSDVQTGEQLRVMLDLPTNGYWDYSDAWVSSPPVTYLRTMRMFTVASRDIVLVQEDLYYDDGVVYGDIV